MAKAWYATTKKNPNKPHVCRYTVPDASAPKSVRQHEEGYATREEAYRAVFAMQQRIDSGEFEAKQYTFGEAIWHWLDTRHIKAVTRRQYRIDINAHLTGYMDKPLREVSQMRRELTDLLNTLCPSAAQNMRVIISGTCDLAMAEGEIPGHRLGMLEIPLMIKRESPLIPHTVKQLNIMLDTVPDNLRLYILLMRGCGLRDGEARAMETDAIHDGYLEVKRATTMGVDGLPKMRREGFIRVGCRFPIGYSLLSMSTLRSTLKTAFCSRASDAIIAVTFHSNTCCAISRLPLRRRDCQQAVPGLTVSRLTNCVSIGQRKCAMSPEH